MATPTSPYPLDVCAIEKGRTFSAEECEVLVGMKRTDARYRLALLALKDRVKREFERQRDMVVSLTTSRKFAPPGGLHICADHEQPVYNGHRSAHGVRTVHRAARDASGTDLSEIPEADRPLAIRQMDLCARRSMALRKRDPVKFIPHTSTLPKMLGP